MIGVDVGGIPAEYILVAVFVLVAWASIIYAKHDTFLSADEKNAKGLFFLSDPSFIRFLIFIPISFCGALLISVGDPPIITRILAYGVLAAVCYAVFFAFGGKESEEKWRLKDKAARANNVIASQQQQRIKDEQERLEQLARDEEERLRHLDEINASFAPFGDRTLSPDEITEHARRVAEELKRGV